MSEQDQIAHLYEDPAIVEVAKTALLAMNAVVIRHGQMLAPEQRVAFAMLVLLGVAAATAGAQLVDGADQAAVEAQFDVMLAAISAINDGDDRPFRQVILDTVARFKDLPRGQWGVS